MITMLVIFIKYSTVHKKDSSLSNNLLKKFLAIFNLIRNDKKLNLGYFHAYIRIIYRYPVLTLFSKNVYRILVPEIIELCKINNSTDLEEVFRCLHRNTLMFIFTYTKQLK